MRMYQLHLGPAEMGETGKPTFSQGTRRAWERLLKRVGAANSPRTIQGYQFTFGPVWNRSYLYLDLQNVVDGKSNFDAYITVYGTLSTEILDLIRVVSMDGLALLGRTPRTVGEDTGTPAYFTQLSIERPHILLSTNESLREWMDEQVGRNVMSFAAQKIVLTCLWIFGAIFCRNAK